MLLRRFTQAGACATLAALVGVSLLAGGSLPARAHEVVHIGLSKNLEGKFEVARTHSHKCKVEDKVVVMFAAIVEMGVAVRSADNDCDELPKSLNGRMAIRWEVVGRADQGGFGTHEGRWALYDGDHRIAHGHMTGTFGSGTHRKPLADCEKCREPLHVEGVLTGEIMRGGHIKASYAGQFKPDPGTNHGTVLITLDGVRIHPCRHP